jgi:hypothetical protein
MKQCLVASDIRGKVGKKGRQYSWNPSVGFFYIAIGKTLADAGKNQAMYLAPNRRLNPGR